MISIALATYNGAKYLREQLHSILNQSYQDWELIACDDNSSDCTFDILKEFSERDKRIHIHKNEQNLGFLKNFEKIFTFCNGDYIACCDQDDIWTEDHLQKLLDQISDNDCIGANALIVDSIGSSTGITVKDSLSLEIFPNDNQAIFKRECFYNLIQGTASLFKRELLAHILPFPDGIKFHDHWIALNASIRNGCSYSEDVVLKYRNHSQNVTGYKKFQLLNALRTVYQARKFRSTMYLPNLAMLRSIQSKITTPEMSLYTKEAFSFFENLSHNMHRMKSVLFYIKHYNEIALCSRKKWKLFSYRVFCLAFFGIML